MTRRPDLFIVGAPKAGTTSLYEYLAGHPEIYMSPVKEPNYFSVDVRASRRPPAFVHGADEARYVALFEGAGDEKRLGEASTSYMVSRVAPSLVHAFQPAARIVAMLRNPVELVYSLHSERVSNGVEPIADFEEALAADGDRSRGERLPDGFNPLGASYRDTARLGEQYERWLATFGRDRVHPIVFEDFAADTPREFRRLLVFLDVSPDYQPEAFRVHNPSHRQRGGLAGPLLRNPLTHWAATRLLPSTIGRDATARLARRIRQSSINRVSFDRQPLLPHVRQQLTEEFRPDVAKLSELVGRDLGQLWFDG